MKKTDIHSLIRPIQPYILLQSDGYKSYGEYKNGLSHFYEFTIDDTVHQSIKAVPDGSIDLLFNIGENSVHTYISGTVFGVKPWQMGDHSKCFGLRFMPGCGVLPKELSMAMLVNEDLEIDGNLFGDNLVDRLAEAEGLRERTDIFKEYYCKLLEQSDDKSGNRNIVDYLKNRITDTKGQISIQELSDETGYSLCYLRRVFKDYYGISPKQFSKFIRFQNLLREANSMDYGLEELALVCGYYDESHMMKEFKNFAGKTMKEYLSMFHNAKEMMYA